MEAQDFPGETGAGVVEILSLSVKHPHDFSRTFPSQLLQGLFVRHPALSSLTWQTTAQTDHATLSTKVHTVQSAVGHGIALGQTKPSVPHFAVLSSLSGTPPSEFVVTNADKIVLIGIVRLKRPANPLADPVPAP
jgi:hypothetical protein